MWSYQRDDVDVRSMSDKEVRMLDDDEQGNYITDPLRLQTCVFQMRFLETKLLDKIKQIKTLEENFSAANAKTQKSYSENSNLKYRVKQLENEVLDLKTRETHTDYALREATINRLEIVKDSDFHKSEVERISKENLELCSQLKDLELEFVKRGQTDQTIHLNKSELLIEIRKKTGLGFDENDFEENPKFLERAMSKCRYLYDFDIIKLGASVDRLVFVRSSDEEKTLVKNLEDAKRNKTNKLQLFYEYHEINNSYFTQDSLSTFKPKPENWLPEDAMPTYSDDQNTCVKPSKVLYYTPTLILEKHFEELQAYIFQMTVSNKLDNHVIHENLELKKQHLENKSNTSVQFEEVKAYIVQMTVSNELERHVFLDTLTSEKHNFENKAQTNNKLLQKEKSEYGNLWEKFCILQKQVTSSPSVSSVTESHVTKTLFEQKISFYQQALKNKDETIDVLQQKIDTLMVSKPCFSQDKTPKTTTPKTTSTEKSKGVSVLKSSIKQEKSSMTKSNVQSGKSKVMFIDIKSKSDMNILDKKSNRPSKTTIINKKAKSSETNVFVKKLEKPKPKCDTNMFVKKSETSQKPKVVFKEVKPKRNVCVKTPFENTKHLDKGFEVDVTGQSSREFIVPAKPRVTIIDMSKSKVVTKSKMISNKSVSVSRSQGKNEMKKWIVKVKEGLNEKKPLIQEKKKKQVKHAKKIVNSKLPNLNKQKNNGIIKQNVLLKTSKIVNACLDDMLAFGFHYNECINNSSVSFQNNQKGPIFKWVPKLH